MRKLFLLGYAASILMLALTGWALYRVTNDALESASHVDHTMRVMAQITGVNASVARAESAQRGYLLYAEEPFLAEREREMQKARIFAEGIRFLTSDNPGQQTRTGELLRLLEERDARMRLNEKARRAMGSAATILGSPSGAGQELTTQIYALTGDMNQEELRLLDQRKAEEARRVQNTEYALAGSVFVFLALIVPGYAGYLRESRARRRVERTMLELAESLPGAVFQYRIFPDGRFRYELLSSATEKIRGVERAAALRDPYVILNTIVQPDRDAVLAALAERGKTLSPIVFDFRAEVNGRVRWIRTVAAPRRADDGSTVWSGHWDDVTLQRELEAELLRSKEAADSANRAKSTFLATMSHEIRTPMNGVLGMLELLALTPLDQEQQTTLGIVRESGKSLLRIIDDILDFSKIEAGKLDLVPEVTSVREVIDRVWAMYTGTASSKGLLLRRFHDARIRPAVMADPIRLQQILSNFVSNSLKFTATGGASISAELVEHVDGEDIVRFVVSDSGIGLSSEQQSRLFQPFTQAHDQDPAHYGGTGLGLSISRRLADLMEGKIEMESEPGRGTRMMFTVALPVVEGVAAPKLGEHAPGNPKSVPVRPAPSIADAERDGRLVLVVDDHPINRMVLLRQMNALGYAAETAEDGLEAMEKWTSGRFSAVITDCNMPTVSGYQLARDIRACESRHGEAHTIIIACTANALGGEAEKCFAAGMDDYLAKPVALDKLAEKLGRWLPIHEPHSNPECEGGTREPINGSPPIDLEMLTEISGGDKSLGGRLLSNFQRYNVDDAQRLREAARNGDVEQVVVYSHRIKGASRTIGAHRLAGVCEALECSGQARDLTKIVAHIPVFDTEVARLNEYIRELAAE